MKKLFLLSCLFLSIFCLKTQSQETVRFLGEGSMIMEDGTEVTGTVGYWYVNPSVVRFKGEGEDKETKYKVGEVKSFVVDGRNFIRIKAKDAIGTNPYTFAEMLTPPDQKMALLLYQQQPAVGADGQHPITKTYYVQIPNDEQVYPAGDIKFMPLHKKMSKIVSDCPELAEKIAKKEKGYNYGVVSSDEMRADILTTIIEEYNACNP